MSLAENATDTAITEGGEKRQEEMNKHKVVYILRVLNS